jgi:hypothetical protein
MSKPTNKDLYNSFKEWSVKVPKRWWEMLSVPLTFIPLLVGVILFARWARNTTAPLSWWVISLVVGGAILFFMVSFMAFHRVRMEGSEARIGKQLQVIETDPDPHDSNQLKLIDSYPKDNEAITKEEIRKIFLKFNKPIDRENMNEALISNYYVRRNMVCQWNICGWIEYDEGDTKLIWHVREDALQHGQEYVLTKPYDYPMFEIRIPQGEKQRRLRAVDGSRLPRTVIRVKIKPSEPQVWSF